MHPIIVVNEAPLSNILNNPAATGRVSLWGIELSPLDITYEMIGNRISSVTGFHSKVARATKHRANKPIKCMDNVLRRIKKRVQGAGAGVVLISSQGDKLKYI
jgi:hypothetical protein